MRTRAFVWAQCGRELDGCLCVVVMLAHYCGGDRTLVVYLCLYFGCLGFTSLSLKANPYCCLHPENGVAKDAAGEEVVDTLPCCMLVEGALVSLPLIRLGMQLIQCTTYGMKTLSCSWFCCITALLDVRYLLPVLSQVS